MSSRGEMLDRIRKALKHPSGRSAQPPPAGGDPPAGGVMPPIAPDEVLPKFELELGKVGGLTYRAASLDGLESILRKILESAPAPSVVLSRNPLLNQLRLEARLREWGVSIAAWPDGEDQLKPEDRAAYREACFAASAGITGVDFVLAETGSLVLTSRTEGSQLASLAPPVHIALFRENQVIESLDEVLEMLRLSRDTDQPTPGRSVVFVTGPSRTADIEQILIRGVHGPGEVHAILVEEPCLASAAGRSAPSR